MLRVVQPLYPPESQKSLYPTSTSPSPNYAAVKCCGSVQGLKFCLSFFSSPLRVWSHESETTNTRERGKPLHREQAQTCTEAGYLRSPQRSPPRSTASQASPCSAGQRLCDQRIIFLTENHTEIWCCEMNTGVVQGPCLQRDISPRGLTTKPSIYLEKAVGGCCRGGRCTAPTAPAKAAAGHGSPCSRGARCQPPFRGW